MFSMLMISKVRIDELTLTYRCQPSDASDSRKVAFNQAEKISRIPQAKKLNSQPTRAANQRSGRDTSGRNSPYHQKRIAVSLMDKTMAITRVRRQESKNNHTSMLTGYHH
jgi:hypothetical protein